MPTPAIISLCLTGGLIILSFIFKVAGKIRLAIPIIFCVLIAVEGCEHQHDRIYAIYRFCCSLMMA